MPWKPLGIVQLKNLWSQLGMFHWFKLIWVNLPLKHPALKLAIFFFCFSSICEMEKHADGFNVFNCLSTVYSQNLSWAAKPRARLQEHSRCSQIILEIWFFVKINLKTSSSELWLSLTYVMDEVSHHEAFKGSGITLGAYSVQWYCVGGSQSGAGWYVGASQLG